MIVMKEFQKTKSKGGRKRQKVYVIGYYLFGVVPVYLRYSYSDEYYI